MLANLGERFKDVTRELLDRHPVWVWDDEMEAKRPVLDTRDLDLPSDLGDLFVRVTFRTAGGAEVVGMISVPLEHYAELFVGERSVYFNSTLREGAIRDREQLRALLGRPDDPVFPLTYESTFILEGRRVAGAFNPLA